MKYINNNGTVCIQKSVNSLQAEIECLTHYSYINSDKQLILLDIQGCGYTLFDPEVASLSSNWGYPIFADRKDWFGCPLLCQHTYLYSSITNVHIYTVLFWHFYLI